MFRQKIRLAIGAAGVAVLLPLSAGTANAADSSVDGVCQTTANTWNFTVLLHNTSAGETPYYALLEAHLRAQFRWQIRQYRNGSLVRTWYMDPRGVTTNSNVGLADGATLPASQSGFRGDVQLQTADGSYAGSCRAWLG